MTRTTQSLSVLAAGLLLTAGSLVIAQNNAPGTSPSSTLNSTDRNFMIKVDQANLAEVSAGQLALKKATGTAYKDFAQHMIDDHSTAENDLKRLAQSKGVTLPTEPAAKDRAQAMKLEKLNGAAFDNSYRTAQRNGHIAVIALFQKELKNGRDGDVKAFAQQYLPKIQEHLRMAEALGNTAR